MWLLWTARWWKTQQCIPSSQHLDLRPLMKDSKLQSAMYPQSHKLPFSPRLIEKRQKMGPKKAKHGVKRGGEMMTKGALRGSGGEQKMGNDDKGGRNVAAAVIVASSRPFVFPLLVASSAFLTIFIFFIFFIFSSKPFVFPLLVPPSAFLTSSSSSPEKITRFLKGGFPFLLLFPMGQILVGGLNQSESCQILNIKY